MMRVLEDLFHKLGDSIVTNGVGLGAGLTVSVSTLVASATGSSPEQLHPLLMLLIGVVGPAAGVAAGAAFRVVRARRRGRIAVRALQKRRREAELRQLANRYRHDDDPHNDGTADKLTADADKLEESAAVDEAEVKAIDAEAKREAARHGGDE